MNKVWTGKSNREISLNSDNSIYIINHLNANNAYRIRWHEMSLGMKVAADGNKINAWKLS